jgi:hypothetical protein
MLSRKYFPVAHMISYRQYLLAILCAYVSGLEEEQ